MKAIETAIGLAFLLVAIRVLIIVGVVALITWVVKKIWNSGNNQKTKANRPKAHNQWTNDWMQNAQARQNNRYEYTDPIQFQKGEKWSPTGWYWDDRKEKWIPPDYLNSKANTRMREPLTPEEQELAKQIRIDRSRPTFEEWKAAQMKKPPDGAYHYDYIHIPNNETITEVKILRPDKIVAKEPEKKETSVSKAPEKSETSQNTNHTNNYEAKSILTYNEKRNYKTLKEAADKKGYTVQLKPRMADIAGSRIKDKRDKQFWINFNKIKAKHVDFAILDENLRIVAVIELDDSSHDTPQARERDAFKDSVLKDCGYKVIHTRYIWPDILDNV